MSNKNKLTAKLERLTVKQERFCNEYMIDLNATQAAVRAGYSAKRAAEIGSQLLHKTTVIKKVAEYRQQMMVDLKISRNDILKTYWQIAQSKPDGLTIKTSDIIKALDKTATMLGFAEPEKKDPNQVRCYEDQARNQEPKQIENNNQETGLSELFSDQNLE